MEEQKVEQVEEVQAGKKAYVAPELKIAAVYDRTQKVPGTFESPTANS